MEILLNPKLLDIAREQRGLGTDAALASYLGLAPSTISAIRNGASCKLGTAVLVMDAAAVTDIRKAVLRVFQSDKQPQPAA